MDKDFDKWNKLKKEIEKNDNNILFKEGEIWWTSIGINIRTESCGKGAEFRRPVLIIKKLSKQNCIIIPLSSQIKTGSWFAIYKIHGKEYTALLYQIKMINISRFFMREGKLSSYNLEKIKKKLKKLLSL